MLILLPPSEGKAAPRRGLPLDLAGLSSPSLTSAREELLAELTALSREQPEDAAVALGLGPTQRDLVDANARLASAPTARADRVYAGVLYDALAPATLTPAGKRRAGARLAIVSALFGLLRPADRIPAYRLSGGTVLPGAGGVAAQATKGRLVRALLEQGADPRTPGALADTWRDLGWTVETEAQRAGTRLDVVVSRG